MTKLMLGGLTLLLAMAAGAAQAREPGSFQLAQVMETPPGCHWIDAGGRTQDLWCRDEDGQARRTSTRRQDTGGYADVSCGRGRIDTGLGCVTETELRRAARYAPAYDPMVNAPPPFDWNASKTPDGRWRDPNRPDVLIVGGGHRWRRAYHLDY